MSFAKIQSIRAYEILAGTGKPAVEVELVTDSQLVVTASVPSGTSKGGYEAFELLDGEKRYDGNGTRNAVNNVKTIIAPAIIGCDLSDPAAIDRKMLDLDGTENKQRLGGNAILPVSAAVYKAASASMHMPLYRYIGGRYAINLPSPIATVIAGGVHSSSSFLDFEDFICVSNGFPTFSESLEAIAAVRKNLEKSLKKRFGSISDTGGALSGPFKSNEDAIEAILDSIDKCGYSGKMSLAFDVAANELYNAENKTYRIKGELISADDLIQYYLGLCKKYPITFFEDAFEENDFESFRKLKSQLGDVMLVGDDLYASNKKRLQTGIGMEATSAILLKINQIGTITEALETAAEAKRSNQSVIVSLRSNDTCDPLIADFATGIGATMIKLGSPVRGERVVKYNRLLSIEDQLLQNSEGGLR